MVGTFQHGAFETRDGGTTWSALSDGLSGATARVALRFAARGSHLYVDTGGAGIFRRPLDGSGSWQPFRSGMPNLVAWNVGDIVATGDRLITGAGAAGAVYLNLFAGRGDGLWSIPRSVLEQAVSL